MPLSSGPTIVLSESWRQNTLIEQGCRCVAHLRGPEIGIAAERLQGYRLALEKRRLPIQPRYVVTGGYTDDSGYEGTRRLLELRPIPDGIFCYNDPVAIGAMKAIFEAGLKVPTSRWSGREMVINRMCCECR